MTNPDTIVARLYKAKYFPNSDLLHSNIGHNPSYVWRSLWSAKFVVRGGLKWSIRSGENISVWSQNWLFDGTSLENTWPNNLEVSNLRVSDLLIPNYKSWNYDLVVSLVGVEAAKKVQNTLLFDSVYNVKLH